MIFKSFGLPDLQEESDKIPSEFVA